MSYFLIGILLSVIGIFLSLFIWGIDKAYFIPGSIGCIFIGISIIFSGSMVGGDRMRADFAAESIENRNNRHTVTLRSALIGIPNLVIALLTYFFLN